MVGYANRPLLLGFREVFCAPPRRVVLPAAGRWPTAAAELTQLPPAAGPGRPHVHPPPHMPGGEPGTSVCGGGLLKYVCAHRVNGTIVIKASLE